MAGGLSVILTILCILMHLKSANATTNIFCFQLENAFPDCECSETTKSQYPVVDCSSKQFQDVPTMQYTYDSFIYKLNLGNNSITTLKDTSFQGLKIEYVDLSGNSLVSVENNTFLSMADRLQTLEIDGDLSSEPPIAALKKLKVIQSLTMRNYNKRYIWSSDEFFLSFTNLKSLTLDRWNLEKIGVSAFLGLSRLESLSLLNQNLAGIPVDGLANDPFDSLETLCITHSPIKTIGHSAFHKLSKLKILDLSYNKIEELGIDCFKGVSDTLQNLNLEGNNLSDVDNKLVGLSGMEALEQLDFSKNIFRKIPSMTNIGLKKPLRLLLNGNEITQVPENSFIAYGRYLSNLDLSGNYIRTIDPHSFNNVTQLNSLYLQSQEGDDVSAIELPISLTNSASTLQTMDLSMQKMDPDSLWRVVKEMTSLVNLNLNSAELPNVPDNIFENVAALEHLNLNSNYFHTITQKTLAGARNLKRLDLVSTRIETIPACLFHGFLSPQITLSLYLSPIKCDCKIKKMIEDYKSDRIVFDSSSGNAECLDGTLLTSIDPVRLICNPPFAEPSCIEYYTTTTPTPTDPTTRPTPEIKLQILKVGAHAIKVAWNLTDDTNLSYFRFHVTSTNSVTEFNRGNIPTSVRVMEADGLPTDTHVTACVAAYFRDRPLVDECELIKTISDNKTPNKEDLEDDGSNSTTTGIIVGCVVAGVALIGIVIAVIILLVFRKKPKQAPDSYRPPTQPRSYTKAELPSMSSNSRTFDKPKKNGKSPRPGNMQVVAISDGQTSPGARVGRVNMMFQPEDGYEPMKNFKKKNEGSVYENDHGALPPTPGPDQDSRPPSYPGATGGYYNQGYNEDKYDQIEVEI